MINKECTKCNKSKSLSEYYKQAANQDGLAYWCKDCCCLLYKTKKIATAAMMASYKQAASRRRV